MENRRNKHSDPLLCNVYKFVVIDCGEQVHHECHLGYRAQWKAVKQKETANKATDGIS
jgi:hypothetical protein